MAHTEQDLRERRAIKDMLKAKVPVREIATKTDWHRSTVKLCANSEIKIAGVSIKANF